MCADADICEGFDDNNDFDSDGTPDGCDATATGDMTLTLDVAVKALLILIIIVM